MIDIDELEDAANGCEYDEDLLGITAIECKAIASDLRRLDAMNKELLAALEFVIEDKAPGYHDCTDDGESECGWCVARKAIAKAKAAS